MKKYFSTPANFIAVFFLLMISSSAIAQGKYRISGKIIGIPAGSTIYLFRGSDGVKVDSALENNGLFILRGHISEPAHMYIYVGKTNKLADLLLDNSEIIITGNAAIYDSVRVAGSIVDAQWKYWFQEGHRLSSIRYKLIQLNKGLSDTIASKIKQVADNITMERILLLKNYVRRYRDSPSGAVLPTLCTIGNYLNKNDYLQMYFSLSPAMQQSSLGKTVKELSEKSL